MNLLILMTTISFKNKCWAGAFQARHTFWHSSSCFLLSCLNIRYKISCGKVIEKEKNAFCDSLNKNPVT